MKNTATYFFQPETQAELLKVPAGTVAYQSAIIGIEHAEPLLLALDGMLRYAKAYRKRFEAPISEDGFAAEPFLETIKGLRALLNMDGAVAMEAGRTTDSKDNGALEGIFWAAMKAAGFEEDAR